MTTIFSPRQARPQRAPAPAGNGRTFAPQGRGIRVEETVSILRPRDELYSFWRNFQNLPRFMKYVESVQVEESNRRSRWVARGPLNVRVSWDAEIVEDRPGELIAWRSLPGSAVHTEGVVQFEHAHGNRGTRVKVIMYYAPPGGRVGDAVAHLFGRSADEIVREDVRRFKRLVETGEIPTTQGQPSGRGRESWEQTASMVMEHRLDEGIGWFSILLGGALLAAPESVAELIGVRRHNTLLRLIGAREVASGIGILRRPRPAGWLWGRVAGDAMDIGLLTSALFKPSTESGRTAVALAAVLGITLVDLMAALEHTSNPPGYRSF